MLKMRSAGPLWNRRATPPTPIQFIGFNIPLEEVNRFSDPDGDWVHVKAHFPLAPAPVEGDVLAADVVPDIAEAKPFEIWSFLKYCTLAARIVNESDAAALNFGVNRDYLIALAIVLNQVSALPPVGQAWDTAFNPFQPTEAEWSAFLNQGNNRDEFFPADRLDPLAQVDAEAALTFQNTKEISEALTEPGKGSGPYIPNSIDLFLARMLGAKAAIEALKKARDTAGGGAATGIDHAISDAGGNPAALRARYPNFLTAGATVSAVLQSVEQKFNAALKLAADLLEDYTPEDLPQVPAAGEPPWFTFAKTQAGVREPDPKIMDYFKATTFHATSTADPWCAAFVTFCMKNCGDATVAANVLTRDNARAASWKTWGRSWPVGSQAIPAGAIVVLSPVEGSDRSGHVSHFVRRDGNDVVLFGGNQGNSVKESNYRASRIAAVRWLDWTGATDAAEKEAKSGKPIGGANLDDVGDGFPPLTGGNWKKYCRKLGERESNNNYAVVNKLGFCGRWQFGATALIDVGYVKPGRTKNSSLTSSSSWTGKHGVSSRADWLSNKAAQNEAMLAYTQAHYKQLFKLGGLQSGSSLPRVVGLLAAAHLMGVGGAMKLTRNETTSDAFGTTSGEYYTLLAQDFGGSATLQA